MKTASKFFLISAFMMTSLFAGAEGRAAGEYNQACTTAMKAVPDTMWTSSQIALYCGCFDQKVGASSVLPSQLKENLKTGFIEDAVKVVQAKPFCQGCSDEQYKIYDEYLAITLDCSTKAAKSR